MGGIWFWLVAAMLVLYVVLDGFDIGVGVLHLFVAKTNDERRMTLASIGPVWAGNEVWLIAGGGTLYFALPLLYAKKSAPPAAISHTSLPPQTGPMLASVILR